MEQKNNTQVPPPAPQISQSAFHIPPTNQQFITPKLQKKFEKLKKSNNKITDELFFELATHLRFQYEALLEHPSIKRNQRLINKIVNKSSEVNIQNNIYLLLNKHTKQPTRFDFPITDIYSFANYIQNLMNKEYLPSETVETDGEDYLLPTLRKLSEKEAQEDQERHNQSPTPEEEDEGLQWHMDGGKKKRKTRRKRKKRKTKKRRKNKRKTKKRRKTKRRKTKRRKK